MAFAGPQFRVRSGDWSEFEGTATNGLFVRQMREQRGHFPLTSVRLFLRLGEAGIGAGSDEDLTLRTVQKTMIQKAHANRAHQFGSLSANFLKASFS
jgi:hypothetical protein